MADTVVIVLQSVSVFWRLTIHLGVKKQASNHVTKPRQELESIPKEVKMPYIILKYIYIYKSTAFLCIVLHLLYLTEMNILCVGLVCIISSLSKLLTQIWLDL